MKTKYLNKQIFSGLTAKLLLTSFITLTGVSCSLKDKGAEETRAIRIELPASVIEKLKVAPQRGNKSTVATPEQLNFLLSAPRYSSSSIASDTTDDEMFSEDSLTNYGDEEIAETVIETDLDPSGLSAFSCLALNIIGPGIADHPKFACGASPDKMGILEGLVPIQGGAIEAVVPVGPGRKFQLIGLSSRDGTCPPLSKLFEKNNQNGGEGQDDGIGDPYELASAVTDIKDDTVIAMKITYDPANPKELFEECEEKRPQAMASLGPSRDHLGPEIPLAGGFKTFDGANSIADITSTPTRGRIVLNVNPNVALDGSQYGEAKIQFTPGDLASLRSFFSDTDAAAVNTVGLYHGTENLTVSASQYRRPVVQMFFDVTNVDINTYPYFAYNMRVRGGKIAGGCDPNEMNLPNYQKNKVAVGVYSQLKTNWMALGEFNPCNGGGNYLWQGMGGTFMQLPIRDLLVTRADGKKFVVLNVESQYHKSQGGNDAFLRIASVRARVMKSPDPQMNHSWPLWITSHGVKEFNINNCTSGTYCPPGKFVTEGQELMLFGNTPKPPIQYSIVGTANGASIDSSTGILTTASSANFSVRAVDAVGSSQEVPIRVRPTGAVIGFKVSDASNNPNPVYNVGACHELKINALDIAGNPVTATGSNSIKFNAWASPTFYSNSYFVYPQFFTSSVDCTEVKNGFQGDKTLSITPGTATSIWFRPNEWVPTGQSGYISLGISSVFGGGNFGTQTGDYLVNTGMYFNTNTTDTTSPIVKITQGPRVVRTSVNAGTPTDTSFIIKNTNFRGEPMTGNLPGTISYTNSGSHTFAGPPDQIFALCTSDDCTGLTSFGTSIVSPSLNASGEVRFKFRSPYGGTFTAPGTILLDATAIQPVYFVSVTATPTQFNMTSNIGNGQYTSGAEVIITISNNGTASVNGYLHGVPASATVYGGNTCSGGTILTPNGAGVYGALGASNGAGDNFCISGLPDGYYDFSFSTSSGDPDGITGGAPVEPSHLHLSVGSP